MAKDWLVGDHKPAIEVAGFGWISGRPFAYQVASVELEHQLGRWRDVLTLALGLIAVVVGAVAIMLGTPKTNVWDYISSALFLASGILAGFALSPWYPRDAPDVRLIAERYEVPLEEITAVATASILKAIDANADPLSKKYKRVQWALGIILAAAVVGTAGKVVESRDHDPSSAAAWPNRPVPTSSSLFQRAGGLVRGPRPF